MLWGLMAAYSPLIAMIATLRYSSESACVSCEPALHVMGVYPA